jgi:hypothetical protein
MKKTALIMLAALMLAAPAAVRANDEGNTAPPSLEGSQLPKSIESSPAVLENAMTVRMDHLLNYQNAHKKGSSGGMTRGTFQQFDLTQKESMVFTGMMWYDVKSTTADLIYYSENWSDDDKELAREFITESLTSLREGMATDLGAPLDGLVFLKDAADFTENASLKPEDLPAFETVIDKASDSLGAFITEEFGKPSMDLIEYGHWLEDIYTSLDSLKTAESNGVPEEQITEGLKYVATQVADSAAYYPIINDDARIANAVKRAMTDILNMENIDKDTMPDLTEKITIIFTAVVNGSFEKEKTS